MCWQALSEWLTCSFMTSIWDAGSMHCRIVWIAKVQQAIWPWTHVDVQQQSKVCIQACALLYIAAFCCTPNCHGIMSQLITGNHVIKFERNSFRVQLSARGIATCFAQTKTIHTSAYLRLRLRRGKAEGAGKRRCGLSLSLSAV